MTTYLAYTVITGKIGPDGAPVAVDFAGLVAHQLLQGFATLKGSAVCEGDLISGCRIDSIYGADDDAPSEDEVRRMDAEQLAEDRHESRMTYGW